MGQQNLITVDMVLGLNVAPINNTINYYGPNWACLHVLNARIWQITHPTGEDLSLAPFITERSLTRPENSGLDSYVYDMGRMCMGRVRTKPGPTPDPISGLLTHPYAVGVKMDFMHRRLNIMIGIIPIAAQTTKHYFNRQR